MQGRSKPDRSLLDATAFCRELVEEGTIYAFLADHRGELFRDEDLSDLFSSGRGRPSVPGGLVASVMVLQSLEGLSDRDAIRACAPASTGRWPAAWLWTTPASTSPIAYLSRRACVPRPVPSASSKACGR